MEINEQKVRCTPQEDVTPRTASVSDPRQITIMLNPIQALFTRWLLFSLWPFKINQYN